MRLCELRQKEVINTCTCRSLGCPVDLEFDRKTGAITALIVPGPGGGNAGAHPQRGCAAG